MIKSIEAPDRSTVVFRLHHPSPPFLTNLAHPANFIYPKKYLDTDPNYFKTKAVGSGPFKLKSYVRGSYVEMERNPDYWKKGLPYLDGLTYFVITDTSARTTALRSSRVDMELRFLPPVDVDAIKQQLGDKIVAAKVQNIGKFGVTVNAGKKPFDDERVRKALTLAIDRYDAVKTLSSITNLELVGGIMHPDSQWSLSQEELEKLPGFGRDHAANLREAKRLLARGRLPQRLQDGADQPQYQDAVHRSRGLPDLVVEEDRGGGRPQGGGDGHLESEPVESGVRAPRGPLRLQRRWETPTRCWTSSSPGSRRTGAA